MIGEKAGKAGGAAGAGEQGGGAVQFSFNHAGLSPVLYCILLL